MKYLIFPDLKSAQARSAAIALAQSAGDAQGDVTKYWFGVIEHPDTKQGAMQVMDEGKITVPETAILQDEAVMKTAGWMPEPRLR